MHRISGLSTNKGIIFFSKNYISLSKNHKKTLVIKNRAKPSYLIIGISILFVLDWVFTIGPVGFMDVFSLMAILYVLRIYLSKDFKKYHGAEHMAIETYYTFGKVTTENIRYASRTTKNCGTSLGLIVMPFVILYYVTIFFADSFIVGLFFIAVVMYVFNDYINGKRKLRKYYNFIFPYSLKIQKKFLTMEPDEKQIVLSVNGINGLINELEKHNTEFDDNK